MFKGWISTKTEEIKCLGVLVEFLIKYEMSHHCNGSTA